MYDRPVECGGFTRHAHQVELQFDECFFLKANAFFHFLCQLFSVNTQIC